MQPIEQRKYPIYASLNLLIIAIQLVALFALFYGTAVATSWWQLLLLAAAFGVVGNSVYSIIHEAEHRILHPNAAINDLLGVGMALFFPAPYHLLRQGHLCHHRCNRTDAEVFDLYFDGDTPWVKWVKFYSIITGVYWITVVLSNIVVLVFPFLLKRRFYEFDDHLASFVDALNPKFWWFIKLEALLAIGLHALIVWSMGIPLLNYAIVYFGFGFSWSAMQYVHHFGTERHVLKGVRNLWLFGPIDLIWLNHNWHAAHHQHPTVPWVYLPRLSQQKCDSQRGFLLWYYLKMWRGPRHTTQHVENKFSGKIIR
jgi:fatty acid desaturase